MVAEVGLLTGGLFVCPAQVGGGHKYLREEMMKTETLQAKEEQTLTEWQVGAQWLLFHPVCLYLSSSGKSSLGAGAARDRGKALRASCRDASVLL